MMHIARRADVARMPNPAPSLSLEFSRAQRARRVASNKAFIALSRDVFDQTRARTCDHALRARAAVMLATTRAAWLPCPPCAK